ncbi:hypothetical protein ACS0TY_000824 [Phlomoides rotata]
MQKTTLSSFHSIISLGLRSKFTINPGRQTRSPSSLTFGQKPNRSKQEYLHSNAFLEPDFGNGLVRINLQWASMKPGRS